MPRTKFPNLKEYPIVVYKNDDFFNGMFTQIVKAREIRWPHGELKGTVFLLHKVPGHLRLWTVTHKETGLDLLGPSDHGDSPEDAKARASRRMKEVGSLLAYMLPKNIVGGVVTERQMISVSKDGKPWGRVHHPPDSYIQKMILGPTSEIYVRNRMENGE